MKPCLIPAYDLNNKKAVFFNQADHSKPYKEHFLLRDVLRSTTAAPTYFSAATITSLENNSYLLVDGGLVANNPSICAYTEALKFCPSCSPCDLLILSLGTGTDINFFNAPTLKNTGILGWSHPFFNILTSGQLESTHYQLKVLFEHLNCSQNYLRIQAIPSRFGYKDPKMDDASKEQIKILLEIGHSLAEDYDSLINDFAYRLVHEVPSPNLFCASEDATLMIE